MQAHQFSIQKVKKMDMVDYLKTIAHYPHKVVNNDYWYLSPLHQEKTPSFKVNRALNCWYDHSLGKGGNLVDFGILYHGCTVSELLKKISDSFSFRPAKTSFSEKKKEETNTPHSLPLNDEEKGIKILSTKPLSHPFLLSYLRRRNIPFSLARQHLQEVHYKLYDKHYYALGFKNDAGGYELRNQHFKSSSSPKNITTVFTSPKIYEVSVFEGMFSFLSYLALQERGHLPLTNFLVLNRRSLFNKAEEKLERFERVHLYLDNDKAGSMVTNMAISRSKKYEDKRSLYSGYKDLNEYLMSKEQRLGQKPRLSR